MYIGEVEDMADAILLGQEPRISLDDSRGNVAAIRRLLESARTGKPVSLVALPGLDNPSRTSQLLAKLASFFFGGSAWIFITQMIRYTPHSGR